MGFARWLYVTPRLHIHLRLFPATNHILPSQPVLAMPADLSDALGNLKVSSSVTPSALKKKLPSKPKDEEEEILDSWETASLSSSSDEAEPSSSATNLAPSTSSSPLGHRRGSSATLGSPTPIPHAHPVEEEKNVSERPAKTDAVARRMISAALGVRTKSTKEQKEFDAALREKEKKKREEEKTREREEGRRQEEAKRSVWED